MLTVTQIRSRIADNQAVNIAFLGDSTTAGLCCVGYPNVWTNGLSYGCVNNEIGFSPTLDINSPYYINLNGYPTQPQQDNLAIPTAVRLVRTYIESLNPASKVYNFGISGADAATHIGVGTVAIIAATVPKPDVVLVNLGINSAKNNQNQNADLQTIISGILAADMQCVLVIPNNMGVAYTAGGVWVAESTPDQWVPMDNWPTTRNGIKALALSNNLEIIDLGSDDGALDITGLYDAFHPSNIGYARIASTYINWTNIIEVGSTKGSLRMQGFRNNIQVDTQGVLRAKDSSFKLSGKSDGSVRVLTSYGVIKS